MKLWLKEEKITREDITRGNLQKRKKIKGWKKKPLTRNYEAKLEIRNIFSMNKQV